MCDSSIRKARKQIKKIARVQEHVRKQKHRSTIGRTNLGGVTLAMKNIQNGGPTLKRMEIKIWGDSQ